MKTRAASAVVESDAPPTSSCSGCMPTCSSKPILLITQTNSQKSCPIFRLPPELRNSIYTYVFDQQPCGVACWDDQFDCPEIELFSAHSVAPRPNTTLLTSCRLVYYEAQGVFLKMQSEFWTNSTFTIASTQTKPYPTATFPSGLRTEHLEMISRINIEIDNSCSTTIYLRSGPDLDWCPWLIGCESTDERQAGEELTWAEVVVRNLFSARRRAFADLNLSRTWNGLVGSHRVGKKLEFEEQGRGDAETMKHLDHRARQKRKRNLRAQRLRRVKASAAEFERSLDCMKKLDLIVMLEYLFGNLRYWKLT